MIIKSFTVPKKLFNRIVMIDRLNYRLNGVITKQRTDKGCFFTITFVTNDQAELFDQLMESIINNVYQY
jgi:hypothetical protein